MLISVIITTITLTLTWDNPLVRTNEDCFLQFPSVHLYYQCLDMVFDQVSLSPIATLHNS